MADAGIVSDVWDIIGSPGQPGERVRIIFVRQRCFYGLPQAPEGWQDEAGSDEEWRPHGQGPPGA